MKPADGNPVTDSDFYNRVDEIARLEGLIEENQHINLVAPRRCGKTSLMREIMRRKRKLGWTTLEIDFSKCTTTAGFFDCFANNLERALSKTANFKDTWQEKLKEFAKTIKRVDLKGIEFGEKAQPISSASEIDLALRELLRGLAETSSNHRLLLGTDEIPIFLAHLIQSAGDDPEKQAGVKQEISSLLYWLRDLRQDESLPVTWFHCGSIGLENLVASIGLTHSLSGLSHQKIYAFSEEHARGLVEELAKSRNLTLPSESVDRMIEKLEWFLPYFVQLHFIKVHEPKDYDRRKQEDYPTVADVDAAYEQMIEEGKIHFHYWDTRLDEQLTKARALQAKDILSWIASRSLKRDTIVAKASKATGDSREQERETKDLLSLLENDGYLMRDETDLYHFRSPLLRDYWRRNL